MSAKKSKSKNNTTASIASEESIITSGKEVIFASETSIFPSEPKVEEKTLYYYGGNFFTKPEDKVRKHFEDALTVMNLNPEVLKKLTNYLFNEKLFFEIANPNSTTVFATDKNIYASKNDAISDINPLLKQ